MQIHAAMTHNQNTKFAAVWVNKYAIRNQSQADEYIRDLQTRVFGVPVVLVAQDSSSKASVYGQQRELVDMLSKTPVMRLPWKTYTIY